MRVERDGHVLAAKFPDEPRLSAALGVVVVIDSPDIQLELLDEEVQAQALAASSPAISMQLPTIQPVPCGELSCLIVARTTGSASVSSRACDGRQAKSSSPWSFAARS